MQDHDKPQWTITINLSDEETKLLADVLTRQSFSEFVNAAINMAAPYGDPDAGKNRKRLVKRPNPAT